MAASRKLQAEIDRCLKKVSEGVELFEDIWTKVHNATNPNQKEKYESDLKKEIKKLQRLRDQIKSWIASGEIKDKSTLIDTRKLIETQMERFKVVERETKTKAYSKEGLVLISKSDPVTKEREILNQWLINTIDSIQMQVDAFENDIETLLVCKKKKVDKDKQEKVDSLKKVIEKHKFHLGKLEVVLRTLDNFTNEEKLPLFLTQVRKIKEDVDYYLVSAQDPEYQDNEFLYDDIEAFDDGSGIGSSTISPTPTPTMETNPTTPTTSGERLTPSFQALVDHQQVYIQQQLHNNAPERRKSYTDESALNAKVFRPMPMKATISGCLVGGGNGAKIQAPVTSNHSVSTLDQCSSDVSEPYVEPVQKMVQQDKISNDTPCNMENSDSGPINLVSFPCEFAKAVHDNYKRTNSLGPTPPPYPPKQVSVPQIEPAPVVTYSSNGINSHSHQYQVPQPLNMMNREVYEHPVVEKTQQEGLVDLSVLPNNNNNNTNTNHVNSSSPTMSASVCVLSSTVSVNVNAKKVARPESEPTVTYTHPTVVQQEVVHAPVPIPPQQIQERIHVEDLPPVSPPHHNQPIMNNASHMRLPPPHQQHDQIMMDQYIGICEPSPMDAHLSSLKSMAQEVMTRAGLNYTTDQRGIGSETTTSAHIPPLLGVAPLGPVVLDTKQQYQFGMLSASHYHMPVSADSEPMRQYLPRNPCATPTYYPQSPLLNSDSLEFFGRLSIETLFFIFYYLEGTRAQYMAAKVLKKQSWRFHTKFMMWFQRHEEPKVINESYEQGTYIYFDIEKWGQRKKDGFVFEYQYLEDRELN